MGKIFEYGNAGRGNTFNDTCDDFVRHRLTKCQAVLYKSCYILFVMGLDRFVKYHLTKIICTKV